MRKFVLAAAAFVLGAGFLPGPAREAGAAISLEKCTLCHGKPEFRKLLVDGQIRELYVTADTLKGSVHEKKACTECHFDVAEIPHRQRPKRVACTHCHFRGNKEGAPSPTTCSPTSTPPTARRSPAGTRRPPCARTATAATR